MVSGAGYVDSTLTDDDILEIADCALSGADLDGKNVLAIVPDRAAAPPVEFLLMSIRELLEPRVKVFDILPETEAENLSALAEIGTIPGEEVDRISDGLFRMPLRLTVDKRILDYDHILIAGSVYPDALAGFSGGNECIFPRTAGGESGSFLSWFSAVLSNQKIIGRKFNPVRKMIDFASAFLPVERSCFSMVIRGGSPAGLYYGTPEESWNNAADLSNRLHITYKDKPFHTVLCVAPQAHCNLRLGSACMSNAELIVENGGTLIIYAPHIREVPDKQSKVIEEIGYHTRHYFMKQWEQFKDYPWSALAHLAHLKGDGTFENGVETPRIDVILAAGLPEDYCRRMNLGYLDHQKIRFETYQNREEHGLFFIPQGGETLYRLRG